jgi:putative transposase
MSGDRYFINDQQATYFITCTVINWIDLFTRNDYKMQIVDSLNYCVKEKGLRINAWVLMSNHLHLICRTESPYRFSDFLRDFKKFTSKGFISTIDQIQESRREWLLDKFAFEARRSGRAENYKVWQDDNHAIDMRNVDLWQKVNYIHENPIRAGYVDLPEHYLYSSARDYAGMKGLVELEMF